MSLRATAFLVGATAAVIAAVALALDAGSGPERETIRPIELSRAAVPSPAGGPDPRPPAHYPSRPAQSIFAPRDDDVDGADDDDPFDDRPESREHDSDDLDEPDDDGERPRPGSDGDGDGEPDDD